MSYMHGYTGGGVLGGRSGYSQLHDQYGNSTEHAHPQYDQAAAYDPSPPPVSLRGWTDTAKSVHGVQEARLSYSSEREKRPNELQSRFSVLGSFGQKKLGHNYRPLKQFRKLLQRLVLRLVFNVLLCAALIGLFHYYVKDGFLTEYKKRIYNALFLGVSLVLGINIMSSLAAMADMMKWRILASGRWSAREIDLLLALPSYQKVTQLMLLWLRGGHLLSALVILVWILLGIGAQVNVAMLGLAYNLDDTDSAYPGRVNVTDLSSYIATDVSAATPGTPQNATYQQQYIAHMLGQSAENNIVIDWNNADVEGSMNDPMVIPLNDTSDLTAGQSAQYLWQYRYRDFTSFVRTEGGPRYYATNRTITVNTTCGPRYPIVEGQDGMSTNITVKLPDGLWDIDWLEGGGDGATVYVNTNVGCGSRCSVIWVFQFQDSTGLDPDGTGDFIECTVDVGHVANAKIPEHNLTDSVALTAGFSIGSTGFQYPVREPKLEIPDTWFEFSTFNNASYWGTYLNGTLDPVGAAWKVAYGIGFFTTGSFANMDLSNPPLEHEVEGMKIVSGNKLTVNWTYVWLDLGFLLGFHAILAIITVFSANSVFQKDDSELATARLLRPIVDRLGPSGSCASGEEIAASLQTKMTYGVRSNTAGDVHHLDIGEDLTTLKTFPKGYYD